MSVISGSSVTGADAGPTIDPRDYFNTVLYAGSASSQSVTGVGFAPEFVWIKNRTDTDGHSIYDKVRGINASLVSNSTAAEYSGQPLLTAFNSDGFTVDVAGSINFAGNNYVAWNWKANGAGSSNTDGSITSTVSAETDSGFSIVTYTGTGSAASLGHGLGAVPRMIIVKNRDATDAWQVYHAANTANPETDYLVLNTTAATADNINRWNDTLPTSTVFSIGNGVEVNTNTEDYVAYCFAEITGFSKINSYTGNGSATGPSVTTGFQPTWLMIKRTDSTGDWIIHDSVRDATNPRTAFLEPNTADTEGSGLDVDFNATGFQIKSTSATVNANGGIYIYMCIA